MVEQLRNESEWTHTITDLTREMSWIGRPQCRQAASSPLTPSPSIHKNGSIRPQEPLCCHSSYIRG